MTRMQSNGGATTPPMTVARKLEELMTQVRELERGGDLEGLLIEGTAEIARLIHEAALAERAKVAPLAGGGFSPSGLPALRRGGDARGRLAAADGADAVGGARI